MVRTKLPNSPHCDLRHYAKQAPKHLSTRGPALVGAFSVRVKSLRPLVTALVTRHQADPDNTSPRPHFLAASSGSKDLWVNTLKFKVGKHPCAHCGVCVLCSVIASVTIQFWYSQSPIVAALHTPANLFRIYSWHQEVNPTYVVRLVSIVCRLWRDVQIMCPPLLDCNIFFQFQRGHYFLNLHKYAMMAGHHQLLQLLTAWRTATACTQSQKSRQTSRSRQLDEYITRQWRGVHYTPTSPVTSDTLICSGILSIAVPWYAVLKG